MYSALKSRLISTFLSTLLFAFLFLLPHQAMAATPNTDPDVPKNSHTYTQTMLIDVLSAVSCQLAGIDPVDPNTPCLTVNPETHKIGYAPQNEYQLGGVIGVLADQIGVLYTPPAATGQYVSYLANNFGIVKPAVAAEATNGCGQQTGDPRDGVGFCSLNPVFQIWKITLNVAYLLLVLAFIFIGLAVMLRIKIDPRTVMTVQNQIPRVVICIILITLSYGISGFMIDMMWTSTYVGINSILQGPQDVELPGNSGNDDRRRLSSIATTKLLDTPISYFNQVLRSKDDGVGPNNDDSTVTRGFSGGIFHVTQAVSRALGGLVRDVITQLLGGKSCEPVKAGFQALTLGIFGSNEVKDCISETVGKVFGFLANIISWLIILVAILISLFRIWFKLLQAYIHILFYVIAAPMWIAMGLIPGRPLGFENWIRNMFANMAVFPLTAFLFVAARIFMDTFNVQDDQRLDPNQSFIPPLVGNPNMEVFGTLLAFGVILMAPGLLDLLKEKLKAQGTKIGGLATATMVAATGAATAIPKRQWASLTSKDQYGNATGPLSSMQQNASRRFMTAKYAPQNLRNTYNKWKDKKQGVSSEYLSWGEKHQEKKDMARAGYGHITKEKWEKLHGEKLPSGVLPPRRGPSVTGPNRAPAGQGEEGPAQQPQNLQQQQGDMTGYGQTLAHQPQQFRQGTGLGQQKQQQSGQGRLGQQPQQQRPGGPQLQTLGQQQGRQVPPEMNLINKVQTKSPTMPGGQGAAKTLPEKHGGGFKDFKADSSLTNKGPLQTKLGSVAPKTEGWKDASKMGQAKPETQQLGSLKVGTLSAGTLNVKGGLGNKAESPGIIPHHPWKEGLKDASHSISEGWKNMGKAENEMAESARATTPPAESTGKITDVGQAAAHNEMKTKQMAEEFAHRMSRYQHDDAGKEGSEESAPPQIAKAHEPTRQEADHSQPETPTMHPGGQSVTKPAETKPIDQHSPSSFEGHATESHSTPVGGGHITKVDVERASNHEIDISIPETHATTPPQRETESSMHPGGQGATPVTPSIIHSAGGHVTAEDVDRQAHANKPDISVPGSHATTPPQREQERPTMHPGGQAAKPPEAKPASPKPDDHKGNK